MNPCRSHPPRRHWFAWMLAVAATAGFLTSGPAQAYEHRKSTPSFGAQFGYGRIATGEEYYVEDYPLDSGESASGAFDLSETHNTWGPSAHFGVRFVLDRNHALGFGFADLRYKRKGGYTDPQKEKIPRWVKFTTFHADYYLYFRRRTKISGYLAPLVGIQQREFRFKGSEVQSGEYKVLYGSSFGVEYFVHRTFSIDLSGRVLGLRGGRGTNWLVQPALGIQIYVI